MDFVNKSYGQMAELFGSMTAAARITMGLLLAVIVMSLLFLFRYQTDHADEYLFGAETVTQGELVAIEAAFGKAGLSHYEVVGNKVKVPRLQRDKYQAALVDGNALPQSFGSAWQKMFDSDSPFDTRDIRERKANAAQETNLAKIVRVLPDIQEATVTIKELQAPGFGGVTDRRALVAVKPIGTKSISESQMTTIRHLVASGSGVKPEYVTVVDLGANGHVSPGTGKEGGVSEFDNVYAANQRRYVEDYTQRLRERLAIYPGIQVAVHVELDKEVHNQTSSFKYDEKPTSIQSTTLTKESTSKAGDNGGRPGAVPNGAVGNAPAQVAAASANEETSNESREDQKSVVGTTQTTTQKAPLIPVAVSASIAIPTSYFATIWHINNPPAPGEARKTPPVDQLKLIEAATIKEIEETVIALLPPPPKGDDRYKPVKVVTYVETPLAEIESPSLAANSLDWFADNWQTLGLFALAAFGVVFLRGMIRSAAQSVPSNPNIEAKDHRDSLAAELEEEEQAASQEPAETAANTLKKRFQSSGRGLRDELTELVREDPDAAASVLKLWISNAA